MATGATVHDGALVRGAHLVNGDPVLFPHLVELVDAHHAVVRQHHRAAFKVKLPCRCVFDHRGCEARCRAAFAGGVDGDGRGARRVLEEL